MWLVAFLCVVPIVQGLYRPGFGTRFQWQLSGHIDYSMTADMYDFDLWDVTKTDIHNIHQKGAKVICYFSAGTYDHNRDDAHLFHASDIGHTMDDWPDEKVLTLYMSENVKTIMAKRMDKAKAKGCDGIEPDNVDGYADGNENHFHYTDTDQLAYNRWLATEAHDRGLSIGLKNDVDQIHYLHSSFDWALNEECHTYNECNMYAPFLSEGKPVFNVEYVRSTNPTTHDLAKCHSQQHTGMSTQFKVEDLTSWAKFC